MTGIALQRDRLPISIAPSRDRGNRVTSGSTLQLYCSSVDDEQYLVLLPGLERLRVDNFLEGNIIFELVTFSEHFPLALVRRAFGLQADEQPEWLIDQIAVMSRE